MTLAQAVAGPAQLQPGAVDQQVERADAGAAAWSRHFHGRGAPALRAVVGDGEVEPE